MQNRHPYTTRFLLKIRHFGDSIEWKILLNSDMNQTPFSEKGRLSCRVNINCRHKSHPNNGCLKIMLFQLVENAGKTQTSPYCPVTCFNTTLKQTKLYFVVSSNNGNLFKLEISLTFLYENRNSDFEMKTRPLCDRFS